MKIVTVPQDITIKFGDGEKVFTCKEVLLFQLDTYAEVKTLSMVRQAAKVAEAIEKGNGTISLEDADYDLLKAACQKIAYVTKVSRQLIPFYEAVEKAEAVAK